MSVDRAAAAWRDFADAVAAAGEALSATDLASSDTDVADALGFLMRLTRHASAAMDPPDTPLDPVFSPFGPPGTSFGIPNPDNLYQICSIHPDHTYVIRGRRNSVHFFSLGAQAPGRAALPGTPSHLGDDRLLVDDGGVFTITVSAQRHSGNWIQIQPDSRTLMVRQTFLRPAEEQAAELSIERVSAATRKIADPLDVTLRRLHRATSTVQMLTAFWPDWVRTFADHAATNEFFIFDEATHLAIGGDPEVRTPLCRWRVGPDEALIVEIRPPECTYWSAQLATLWTEQMPARTGQSSRNNAQVVAAPDGIVRLVVSPRDPGCDNWLDSGGRLQGLLTVRWVGARHHPLPSTKLVALTDLSTGKLP
jgi:hypothetical protein